MDLHVDDDGFVRADRALVYRRLTNIRGWPRWWPGVRVAEISGTDDEVYALELRAGWRSPLRMLARAGQWRHHAGFQLDLAGDLDGRAEFWLEEGFGGTVVHHILSARTDKPGLRVLRAYRLVLRRGLWAFKDLVQEEVRETAELSR